MTDIQNPICVAIDTPDLERASFLAHSLKGHVGYLKVGMEFYYAHGQAGYMEMARHGVPIFLDLKLHDIPNTVANGLNALMQFRNSPRNYQRSRHWRTRHVKGGGRCNRWAG